MTPGGGGDQGGGSKELGRRVVGAVWGLKGKRDESLAGGEENERWGGEDRERVIWNHAEKDEFCEVEIVGFPAYPNPWGRTAMGGIQILCLHGISFADSPASTLSRQMAHSHSRPCSTSTLGMAKIDALDARGRPPLALRGRSGPVLTTTRLWVKGLTKTRSGQGRMPESVWSGGDAEVEKPRKKGRMRVPEAVDGK